MSERRPEASEDRLHIDVDRSSATPPYEQISAQVRDAIDRGALTVGTRMPTVRALAERTGLVPNTVAKAYQDLEADGVLEGRGRAGTFVLTSPDPLDHAARAYLARADELGAGRRAAIDAVRRAADRGVDVAVP